MKLRQRGRNSRKEPKPKSGHKISAKHRGSATGACTRSRRFNCAVLPYIILYLTTTYAIPQANKRKCHKKVILCSGLTCHSECTVVYYKCIVMIDRKVFSWNISPTHPRRPKHSAQNTQKASRQAMLLRSPATSVPARPHSRAACCTDRLRGPRHQPDLCHCKRIRNADGQGRALRPVPHSRQRSAVRDRL